MVLTIKEEISSGPSAPYQPEAADHVIAWTRQLTELAQGKPVEWSDS
jgi:hypothetical protein